MDGFKKRLSQSIQLKLSFSLSLYIVAIALVAGIISFVSAFDEAHELQDNTLRQIASLIDQQGLSLAPSTQDVGDKEIENEALITVQYLSHASLIQEQATVDTPLLPLSTALNDGFHTQTVNGTPLRIFVKTSRTGKQLAIAQGTAVRDEIARDSALHTLMPFIILIPILLIIVANLVHTLFQPIASLSEKIDQRAEQELHAIEYAQLPIEVRPFAVAINRLLGRVEQSMEVHRRFVADAAHELRTPLTALSLQAERLANADMSQDAQERLATLRSGIRRSRNLMDQLLTLAKAQAILNRPQTMVSVQSIFRHVLEDLVPLIDAKQIDIEVGEESDVCILLNEQDLLTLVKNLVDNAIRYTPNSGQVSLFVTSDKNYAYLKVQDSGPGISVTERERVFDAFYRTFGSNQIGSGLGLSIVKTICDRFGAEIHLEFSDELAKTGLSVRVALPLSSITPLV